MVQKTLSANPNVNVNEKLLTVTYQKIIRAIRIRNNILSSKLSKYNLKKLIQLKHQITKKESNIITVDLINELFNKFKS